MQESSLAGEIKKKAQILFKVRGQNALKYANMVFQEMQKTGDKKDSDYWHGIVKQVEILVEETGPC